MNFLEDISGSFSFSSAQLFIVIIPALLLLIWELNLKRKRVSIALTDLEYLRASDCMKGKHRHLLRVILLAIVTVMLGMIWAGPILHTSTPLFSNGEQSLQKNIIVAIDISRSMGQPLKIPDKEERFANYGSVGPTDDETEKKQSRYESARQTLYNFFDRFKGARIGLILFSTEPFLARWPTTETENRFIEVMEEKLGQGERSQLQRFSSLTNIDEALRMTREVFSRQAGVEGGAVILISDAEDELENMGLAIRMLRSNGIRLYTIGVGISEIIVEKLSNEFTGDPGFRIFHVESEEEMQEAYDLVSTLEESSIYASEEQEFITDMRWVVAIFLVFISAIVIWLAETIFHQSWIVNQNR
jgi:hypothetical protein